MTYSLQAVEGGFALQSPFNRDLVDAIKALPYADRRWDNGRRAWIIASSHVDRVVQIVEQVAGVSLQVPVAADAGPTLRAVKMDYLGRCKDRGGNEPTATGFADGWWSLVFPESVLRTWFLGDPETGKDTGKPQTLYQVLTVKQDASPDELKAAYRRLVFQTHPDRNKEPDAREQFEAIQKAYEVLRDERTRRKYNAGLKLEASTVSSRPRNFLVCRHDDDALGYRSPLRCGYLFLEGIPSVGQLVVSKIMEWSDIRDNRGRTMVSSWKAGAETFSVEWW
jgi:DnaJ-domain-containing protein 1